jgi:hypothetical protein
MPFVPPTLERFLLAKMSRRDVFRAAAVGAAIGSGAGADQITAAEPAGNTNKRRARYQATAPEVQDFYRVNRYPAR